MAMVSVVTIAAYRRIYWSRRCTWSKGRWMSSSHARFAKWTRWTLAMAVPWWQMINIVLHYYYYFYYCSR